MESRQSVFINHLLLKGFTMSPESWYKVWDTLLLLAVLCAFLGGGALCLLLTGGCDAAVSPTADLDPVTILDPISTNPQHLVPKATVPITGDGNKTETLIQSTIDSAPSILLYIALILAVLGLWPVGRWLGRQGQNVTSNVKSLASHLTSSKTVV